jgi:valyl-tRNA synthetase
MEAYPRAADFTRDDKAVAEIEWLKAVLTEVRRIRSEMNIAPSRAIPLLYRGGDASDRARTTKFAEAIAFLARTESQRWLEAGETEPASASAIVGGMKLLIPLAGLIDLDAERARLSREIGRIEVEIGKSNAKLGKFGPNTPAAVVDQEKQRLADFEILIRGLRDQRAKLEGL